MIIAIDFDGTLKRSSQFDETEAKLWALVVNSFWEFDHQVCIATSRTEEMRADVDEWLALANLKWIPIVFCGDKPKRQACREFGIDVDVWIDDMPESIGNTYLVKAKEVGA